LQRGVVVVRFGQVEQLARIAQAVVYADECAYDFFQRFLFAAQLLGALGIVPDLGVLDEMGDFL